MSRPDGGKMMPWGGLVFTMEDSSEEEKPLTKEYMDMIREDQKQKNQEQFALIARLEAEGHCCLKTTDSAPIQVFWCQQMPCVKTGK